MSEKTQDLYLQQGKTQPLVLRCETVPIVYKTISAIQKSAPVRMTLNNTTGLLDGWRVAVTGVKDIDTEANKVKDKERILSVLDFERDVGVFNGLFAVTLNEEGVVYLGEKHD